MKSVAKKHWTSFSLTGACPEAKAWARGYPTFAAAWRACPRGDWMLWWIQRRFPHLVARLTPAWRAYLNDEYVNDVMTWREARRAFAKAIRAVIIVDELGARRSDRGFGGRD